MREADKTEIEQALLNGFVFRGSGSSRQAQGKVKTKAKRTGYITGYQTTPRQQAQKIAR